MANDNYNADIDPVEQFARGVKPNPIYIQVYETGIAPETKDHL